MAHHYRRLKIVNICFTNRNLGAPARCLFPSLRGELLAILIGPT